MTRTRTWLARALATLACLTLPLGLVSAWMAAVATDTDEYVDTVGPLASDPDVRRVVQLRLEELALRAIDPEQRREDVLRLLERRGTGPMLREGATALADLAVEAVEDTVHRAVDRVVNGPELAPAWRSANESAHRYLVGVLSGEIAVPTQDERVSVQLGTLLDAVLAILADAGLAEVEHVPEVDTTFALMTTNDVRKAQDGYRLLEAVGFWVPLTWLVLAVATVLVAPGRRRALAWLAYGSVVALVLLAAALALARDQVLEAVPDPDDTALVAAVWDIVLSDLRAGLVTLLVAAVAVVAVLWATGPARVAARARAGLRRAAGAVRGRLDGETLRVGLLMLGAGAVTWWLV